MEKHMASLTYKKGEATKLIDSKSKLIPVLEKEGWVNEANVKTTSKAVGNSKDNK